MEVLAKSKNIAVKMASHTSRKQACVGAQLRGNANSRVLGREGEKRS